MPPGFDAAIAGETRLALRHLHSQDNPEADWGAHVRQAVHFAFDVLGQRYARTFDAGNVRVLAVGISNGGGAVLKAAELDDGLLDVVFFHPMSRGELVRAYPKLFSGTHTGHPAYEHHRVRQVTDRVSDAPSGAGPSSPCWRHRSPRCSRSVCGSTGVQRSASGSSWRTSRRCGCTP